MVITGPGLIVMVGDNDAGGVATYAQAGQNYGMGLLWTLALLIPVLYVNQEMVLRLGAVTRVGHARLIFERFGKFWGAFSVGDLLILNALTIVTEFIGVALALGFLGCPKVIAIPAAAVLLFAVVAGGSFRRWEGLMFLLIAVNVLIIPMVLLVHPSAERDRRRTDPAVPGRAELHRAAVDRRDRGHHGGALAIVLPAVQRGGQAHHGTLDSLRTSRFGHRNRRGHGRGDGDDGGDRVRIGRHHGHRKLHRRGRSRNRPGPPPRQHRWRCCSRSSCWTHR